MGIAAAQGRGNRAFGAQLRLFLASATRNRFSAFGAGLVTTLALQSSTAMAVMASSFVAQLLSLDIHWLASAVNALVTDDITAKALLS